MGPRAVRLLACHLSPLLLLVACRPRNGLVGHVDRVLGFDDSRPCFRPVISRSNGRGIRGASSFRSPRVRASVQRMRSGNLWSRGARFGTLHVPPRTMTVPFARRLVIVHQDLGNWSSSFFNAPGYSLLAPVVGCLAYDASGSTSNAPGKLELRVLGDPISITFPRVTLPAGLNATIKCARLGPHGSVAQLADAASDNACAATRTGHFTVVVPSAAAGEASETTWRVWAVACGSGVVGLLLVGLVGMGIMRLTRNRKMEEMEQQAAEGEALGTTWAGRSKMPSAAMSRTAAVMEDGTAAP